MPDNKEALLLCLARALDSAEKHRQEELHDAMQAFTLPDALSPLLRDLWATMVSAVEPDPALAELTDLDDVFRAIRTADFRPLNATERQMYAGASSDAEIADHPTFGTVIYDPEPEDDATIAVQIFFPDGSFGNYTIQAV